MISVTLNKIAIQDGTSLSRKIGTVRGKETGTNVSMYYYFHNATRPQQQNSQQRHTEIGIQLTSFVREAVQDEQRDEHAVPFHHNGQNGFGPDALLQIDGRALNDAQIKGVQRQVSQKEAGNQGDGGNAQQGTAHVGHVKGPRRFVLGEL